jgi:predicted MPP superfamily phosphohydrolase
MPLNIQIASDLHIEFWIGKNKAGFVKPAADILALLGDTCCVGSESDYAQFKAFITSLLPHYKHIILVSGNHEYYFNKKAKEQPTAANTIEGCDKKIQEFCRTSPKLHYLNNSSLKLQIDKHTYLIAGSVLWSWIPDEAKSAIENSMNDYSYIYVEDAKTRKIRGIKAADVCAMHLRNVKYLRMQMTRAKKENARLVILTHHKPYLSPSYNVKSFDPAYESDLAQFIKSPVVAWCYGHTHVKDERVINGVKVVSNPKGYPRQQTKYNASHVVAV